MCNGTAAVRVCEKKIVHYVKKEDEEVFMCMCM